MSTFSITLCLFLLEEFLIQNENEKNSATDAAAAKKSLLHSLIEVASLNSKVLLEKVVEEEDGALEPTGDATELGLYRY